MIPPAPHIKREADEAHTASVSYTERPCLKRESESEIELSSSKRPCMQAISAEPLLSDPRVSEVVESTTTKQLCVETSAPESGLNTSPPEQQSPHLPVKRKEQRKQDCNVCWEPTIIGQFKKFKTCPHPSCNKTCNFCWTKIIKTRRIEDPTTPLKCFMCEKALEKEQIIGLLHKAQGDIAHYEYCCWKAQMFRDDERECSRNTCKSIQVHKPQERIFACTACSAQDCIVCNAPEHDGETCSQYQNRLLAEHGEEEEATALCLRSVDTANMSKSELAKQDKLPSPCPGCGILIMRAEDCHIMHCIACGMHFCIRVGCGAKYLGGGTVVPLVGNAAHANTCRWRHRAEEDRRFIKAGPKPRKALGCNSSSDPASASLGEDDIPENPSRIEEMKEDQNVKDYAEYL